MSATPKGEILIELEAMSALSCAFPFSPKKIQEMVASFGCALEAVEANKSVDVAVQKVLASGQWERNLQTASELGLSLIALDDPCYPSVLYQLSDPPPLLYVMGELLPEDRKALGIVGTRQASLYGKSIAHEMASHSASQGFTIVSGLARGIDTAAHEGALNGGRTIAVIGSGLASIYPQENRPLAERIAKRGCILSEYPVHIAPDRFQFPRRNRIIAALSLGVLLIEGAEKSGGMITMELAEKLGKPCFALPGRVDMESFRGNHALIKRGKAKLVENAEEMLSLLVPRETLSLQRARRVATGLSVDEAQLISHFPEEEISLEELGLRSCLPTAKLNANLISLMLKKMIQEYPGKMYKKVY